MSKKVKWANLPEEERQQYIDRAISYTPLKDLMEEAKRPLTIAEIKARQEKWQAEFEAQRVSFGNMFDDWGKALYEDNSEDVAKWFLDDDPEQYIEDVSHLVNGKKGKELYTVVLAMQRNKQLKSIGYNELSELFRVLSDAFDIPDSRKSFQDAHNKYQSNGEKHIKEQATVEVEAKLRQEIIQPCLLKHLVWGAFLFVILPSASNKFSGSIWNCNYFIINILRSIFASESNTKQLRLNVK